MIKKIQIEIVVFIILVISIFYTNNTDVWIYNYFSQKNYGVSSSYLKSFFVNITELGNSLWYYLILFFLFIISFFAKKINFISFKNYSYLRNFSIFSITYLLATGIVTQILKHLIGRVRPNHINLDEIIFFNFFTTNSAFHSFPSGHTSTIISFALVLCLTLPSLKIFLFISGLIIAISRVVVGAHYFTDVIGGLLIAVIVYKISIFFYTKVFPKNNINEFKIQHISILNKIQIVFVVIAIFVTVGPGIDVYFSSIFYYNNNQFLLQNYYTVSIIFRKILLPLLLIYIFILPMLSRCSLIKKLFFNYIFSFKELLFIWASGLITIIFIVNILLKGMWGRVRPNDILNFGGENSFTPWYKFGDSCISNCSFVSGDASVGFALLVFYFITKKNIYCYLSLFFGTTLGFIRIIAGGHFFSDIVFAQLVIAMSFLLLFTLYKKLHA